MISKVLMVKVLQNGPVSGSRNAEWGQQQQGPCVMTYNFQDSSDSTNCLAMISSPVARVRRKEETAALGHTVGRQRSPLLFGSL